MSLDKSTNKYVVFNAPNNAIFSNNLFEKLNIILLMHDLFIIANNYKIINKY